MKLLKSFTDYNALVIIEWNHNHSVTAFHALSFRDIHMEVCIFVLFSFYSEQSMTKLMAKRQKTALSLTPQAMHNQFKRPSEGIVRELYYVYRKTYDLGS